MDRPNLLFADISSNNADFDAVAYRADGHLLVAIKATEGLTYVNPKHRSWCLHAGMHHVGVVHYHFGRPDLGNSPGDEAVHFLRTVHGLAGGRDYLVLDCERPAPTGFRADPAWCNAFAQRVSELSRFHVILYASRSLLSESDAWLPANSRRVWEADWSSQPDWAPTGYSVAFRQFTNGVAGPGPHGLAGVGRCDVSWMSLRVFDRLRCSQPAHHGHRAG